jgi:predicted MFS family arabinose efflux permease
MLYSSLILAVLFLARTAMGFQFQSVASVAPFLVHSLHLNYAEIGTLIGLFSLPGAIVSLPAGIFARHVPDRAFAGVALALMVVGGVMLGLSHGYAMALSGRLVSGVGGVLLNLALTKMTTDWFATRGIVLAMGVLLASWPLGIATGLVFQAAMAAAVGWPDVMYLAAGISSLAMLLVFGLYRAPGAVGRKTRRPRKTRPALAWIALPPWDESLPAMVSGAIWGSYNIGMIVFFSFGPLLLVEQGALPVQAASWTSVALWICMFSLPLGGLLVHRTGHGAAVVAVACFIAAWALALLPSGLWPVALSAILGLAIGPPSAVIMALPARALGLKNRASGLGLFFTVHYALIALGPVAAGYLRDATGTAATAAFFGAACFVAVLPLQLLFEQLCKGR